LEHHTNIVNIDNVPEEEWEEGRFGAREKDLGKAAGSLRIGLRRETLPPGKQSSPQHAHMAEEELFLVLRGSGSVLEGDERLPVRAGDVVSFPAGTGLAHAFLADAAQELEYLSFGERNPNDVVIYPNSGKVLIRALEDRSGRPGLVGRLAEADYWEGEP
jgi:uncharacterized cupin superfamily protein